MSIETMSIQTLNDIIRIHRADRPEEGVGFDGQGLRPISFSWVNHRVQVARTLVTAANEIIEEVMQQLESDPSCVLSPLLIRILG